MALPSNLPSGFTLGNVVPEQGVAILGLHPIGDKPAAIIQGNLNCAPSLFENVWMELQNSQMNGIKEAILVFNLAQLLGKSNMIALARRFKFLINQEITTFYDDADKCMRMMPASIMGDANFLFEQHQRVSRAFDQAMVNGQISSLRADHIPRPPNSFICYRQHHHHAVAEANPGLANCEISKIIGKMWKEESAETRARFRDIAEHMKREHMLQHPDYQYTPRRPGSKRVAVRAKDCWCLSRDALGGGAALYFHSTLAGDGWLDINDSLVSLMGRAGTVQGPNGVGNMPTFNVIPPEMRITDELNGVSIENLDLPKHTTDFSPMEPDWFGPDFPYNEVNDLLHLDGASGF